MQLDHGGNFVLTRRLAALFRFSSDYLRGTGLVLALIADALDEQEHADAPAREEGERADADARKPIGVVLSQDADGSMRVLGGVELLRAAVEAEIARSLDAPCSDPDCSTCKPN